MLWLMNNSCQPLGTYPCEKLLVSLYRRTWAGWRRTGASYCRSRVCSYGVVWHCSDTDIVNTLFSHTHNSSVLHIILIWVYLRWRGEASAALSTLSLYFFFCVRSLVVFLSFFRFFSLFFDFVFFFLVSAHYGFRVKT